MDSKGTSGQKLNGNGYPVILQIVLPMDSIDLFKIETNKSGMDVTGFSKKCLYKINIITSELMYASFKLTSS